MASKEEILASARKRRGGKQKIYRRGRGGNTNISRPSVDKSAGRDAEAVQKFLGTMLNAAPKLLDEHNQQLNKENKETTEKGIAQYKNATPIQRQKFREAIRSGKISEGESPYFREGLQRAYAEEMSINYGIDVMKEWNASEAKNSSDPQAFTKFLEEYKNKADGPPGTSRSWIEQVNDLNPHVALEEFHSKTDAIDSKLASMHSQHQREQYTLKARDRLDSAENKKFTDTHISQIVADNPIEDRLLKEHLQNDAISAHVNVIQKLRKNSGRRVRTDGNLKSRFIANEIKKGKSRSEANFAWNSERKKIGIDVMNTSKETVGLNTYDKMFTVSAFKKEEKEKQIDIADYNSRHRKDKSYTKDTYKQMAESLVSPVESFDDELIAEIVEMEPADAPLVTSSITAEVKPELDHKDIKLAEFKPKREIDRDPPKPKSIEKFDAVVKTESKPEEIKPKLSDKKVIAQEVAKQDWSKGQGIDPTRDHYGLVAYNTEEEAEQIIEGISKNVVGEQTGEWDFSIIKVGKLYQVQAQGSSNVTDNQREDFFKKLNATYDGEIGNRLAGPKEKGYVQLFNKIIQK